MEVQVNLNCLMTNAPEGVFSQEFLVDLHDPDKLTKPIKAVEEKWRLLPAFLKTKGLVGIKHLL